MSIKDSGKRKQFPSGMQRDVTEDKTDYLMLRDGPMFERWARHLTHGAKKYDKRNWMKASSEEELMRFKESAARHFEQWVAGETDEDHAAATFFNMNGAEHVRARLMVPYSPTIPPMIPPTIAFTFLCKRCGTACEDEPEKPPNHEIIKTPELERCPSCGLEERTLSWLSRCPGCNFDFSTSFAFIAQSEPKKDNST